MATKKSSGIGTGGKIAILLVLFGIPALFFFSSWGLLQLFNMTPYILLLVLLLFATIYTARTSRLLYEYYGWELPLGRFLPCVGEVFLMDVKYRMPCYIMYVAAIIFVGISQLPYSVMKMLGDTIALKGSFYFFLIALVLLAIIQVVKGIGLVSCMKDISADWYKQTHAEIGAINILMLLSFIPFVRVIAIYAMNKPLSTMVDFMNVTIADADEDAYYEEEDDYDN